MPGHYIPYQIARGDARYLFREIGTFEKRIILNTSFKFVVNNPQYTGYFIDLIHLGNDAILSAKHSPYESTGNYQLHLHINDQPTGFYIDQSTWTCVEFEVDMEEMKILLHINGKRAGEQPYTGGDIRFVHLKPVRSSYTPPICSVSLDVESFILIDGSGDVNNTRLGKAGVTAIRPTVTVEQGFSPVGATSNHGAVADNDPSFETTFVQANKTGAQDIYGTTSTISVPDVKSVTLLTTARRAEADYMELHPVLRQNGEDIVYPHTELKSAEWRTSRYTLQKNPVTGLPWTHTDVQDLQWGQRIGERDTTPTVIYPTPSEPPGSQTLRFGDENLGYYGTVSSNEFITGTHLASALGINAGNSYDNTPDWLKFAHNGKTLYVPKRPLREGVSWLDIYNAGLVYGVAGNGKYPPTTGGVDQLKTVTIGGRSYIVRLLKGADDDPNNLTYNVAHPAGTHNSEWAQLVLRTSANDPNGSHWESFSDVELGMDDAIADRISWCQETWASRDGTYRVTRGVYGQALTFGYVTYATNVISLMWRPVLELIDN